MATKAEVTLTINSALVSLYVETAQGRNAGAWEFLNACKGKSVRVVQDSIKQGKKDSGIALPDLTPTKAQHFETLNAMRSQFADIESEVSFSKAYSVAEKSDRAYGATGARNKIASMATLEELVKSLPKTVRPSKAESTTETEADLAKFSTEQILEHLKNRIPAVETDRAEFVKVLTLIAKTAKAMKVTR